MYLSWQIAGLELHNPRLAHQFLPTKLMLLKQKEEIKRNKIWFTHYQNSSGCTWRYSIPIQCWIWITYCPTSRWAIGRCFRKPLPGQLTQNLIRSEECRTPISRRPLFPTGCLARDCGCVFLKQPYHRKCKLFWWLVWINPTLVKS